MKNRHRILLAFIVVVVALTTLIVSRHAIIRYLLQYATETKTQGKITLNPGQLYMDMSTGDITITHPQLKFKDMMVSAKDSLFLSRLDFEKLTIKGMSLSKLIFHRAFFFKQLVAQKPSLELLTTSLKPTARKGIHTFDPFLIVKILKSQSFGETGLQLSIGHTEIRFGKVNLLQAKAANSYGSASYTVMLDGLKTVQAKGGVAQTLSYRRVVAGIGHLNYYFSGANYTLKLDTAKYHSEHKRLEIDNVVIQKRTAGSEKGVRKFSAGNITLQGIVLDNEDSLNSKDLHLRSVVLKNSTIAVMTGSGKADTTQAQQALHMLFQIFPALTIDTVSLKNLDLLLLKTETDTAISVKKINLFTTGLLLNSNMVSHPLQQIKFSKCIASSGACKWHSHALVFRGDDTYFSEQQEQMVIHNLHIQSKLPNSFNAFIPKTEIKNIAVKPLQKRKRQKITLLFSGPLLSVKSRLGNSLTRNSSQTIKQITKFFSFGRLMVHKGDFHFQSPKGAQWVLNHTELELQDLSLSSLFDTIPRILYRRVHFSVRRIAYTDSVSSLSIKGNNVLLDTTRLTTDSLHFRFVWKNQQQNITMVSAQMYHPDFNAIVFQHRLRLSSVWLFKPDFELTVNRTASHPIPNNISGNRFRFFINRLKMSNAHLHLNSIAGKDTLQLETDFVFNAQRFNNEQQDDVNTLLGKDWQLALHHFQAKSQTVYATLTQAAFNRKKRLLQLHNLFLNLHNAQSKKRVRQLTTSVAEVTVQGVNYPLLFRDTLSFSKATVEGNALHIANLFAGIATSEKSSFSPSVFFDSLSVSYRKLTYLQTEKHDTTLLTINHLKASYAPNERKKAMDEASFDLFRTIRFRAERLTLVAEAKRLLFNGTKWSYFPLQKSIRFDSIWGTKYVRSKKSGLEIPFDFTANKILISKPVFYLNRGIFMAHSFEMGKLNLQINRFSPHPLKDTLLPEPPSPFKKSALKAIIIDTLFCNNLNMHLFAQEGTKQVNADSLCLSVQHIHWNKSGTHSKPPAIFEDLSLDLRNKRIYNSDSMYLFGLKGFSLNLPQRRLLLDTLTLFPSMADSLFFRKSKFQTDRIQFVAYKIVASDFDLDTLFASGFFHTKSLMMKGFMMNILRDKRYPLRPHLYKKMPLELLASIPFPFFVDSIGFTQGDITYGEHAVKSDEPGTITFSNLASHWYSVTNEPTFYQKFPILQSDFSGKIMGQAAFALQLYIPYQENPFNRFWYKGHITTLHLKSLNGITKNLMGVIVRKGKGSVDIPYVSGNDSLSKGRMVFKYHQLKFGLYNRKKAENYKGIATPFINFMLNSIMIRSNNPRLFGKTQIGIIYFARDKRKSFFNYIWKSLLSGTLSTMGFNTRQQRQERKEFKKNRRKRVKSKGLKKS